MNLSFMFLEGGISEFLSDEREKRFQCWGLPLFSMPDQLGHYLKARFAPWKCHEPTLSYFHLHSHRRQDGNPHAEHNALFNRFDAVQLQICRRIDSCCC